MDERLFAGPPELRSGIVERPVVTGSSEAQHAVALGPVQVLLLQRAGGDVDEERLQALALGAARGDEAAFGELRQAVEPMVRSYLDHKIREPTLVPGLTDTVFEVARRALPKYSESELHPRHWLLRVSRWVVVRYYEFSSAQRPRR